MVLWHSCQQKKEILIKAQNYYSTNIFLSLIFSLFFIAINGPS